LIDYNRNRLFRLQSKSNNENISRDIGIDLIQLNTDGEYVLVQCKNYTKCLCIHHLAGFYMRMCNNKNAKGIVYCSTDKLSCNITNYNIGDRIKYICKPIRNVIMNNNNIIAPYPYQSKIIKKLCKYYISNDRGILTMPCGTGKTLISCYLGKQFDQIIFISPLKQFAEQNKKRYEEYDHNRKGLLIDSDGTRNRKDIKKFIRTNKKFLLSATYKSCDVVLKILPKIKKPLIIIDEFHNLSYNNIYGNDEDPLYNIINSDYKILYMSATPRIYDLEDKDDCDVEYALGRIIYKMNFSYAIKKKYICDYDIILPITDTNDFNNVINEIRGEIGNELVDEELSKKCCYLYECIKRYGTLKCIIYFQSHNHIKSFIKAFNTLNKYYGYDYYIDSITCNINQKERANRINKFKSSSNISLLCSVQILDECIDIAECNSIYVTYNCKSKVKNIQRMCRAMRTDKNHKNKRAKIILWCNEFSDILTHMSSIKEYDLDFHQKIKFIKCSNSFNRKMDNDKYNKQCNEKYKKYIVGIKEYRGFNWNEKYNELVEYIKKYNNLPYNRSKNKKIKQLSKWVYSQNQKYKKRNQIIKNKEIYNKWTTLKETYKQLFLNNVDIWNNKYDELIEYMKENNKLPTSHSKNTEIKKLGYWVSAQKEKYKKKTKIMKNEEIYDKWTEFREEYEQLFWSNDDIWNNKYDELVEYIKEYKKLPSACSKNKKIKRMGGWISLQNNNYKKKTQIMKNEEIYDKWTELKETYKQLFLSNCDVWDNNFNELTKYIKKHDKLPSEYYKTIDKNIKKLGKWAKTQQTQYNKKTNIMKNKKIYNKWTTLKETYKQLFLSNDDIWNNKYDELIEYIDKYDKLPSSHSKNIEIKKLGGWLGRQQENYKNKTKSMNNVKLYNKWTIFKKTYKQLFLSNDEIWNDKYDKLVKYIEENKKLPKKRSKNTEINKLGNWVASQKQNYKKKTKIMNDVEIYNKWTKLKENYNYLFENV